MTKEQLKYLALLPQVIDALNAFAAEAEALRAAAARAGFGPPPVSVPHVTVPNGGRQATAPSLPPPVNLQTPERAEYKNGNPPATEEDAVGANTSSLDHLKEARLRRAQMLKQARQDPTRAEKLAQFRHDTETAEPDHAGEAISVSSLNLGDSNG